MNTQFETQLNELAEKRIVVEARGLPEEYRALANEYEQIGALSNAASLRRKADGIEKQLQADAAFMFEVSAEVPA